MALQDCVASCKVKFGMFLHFNGEDHISITKQEETGSQVLVKPPLDLSQLKDSKINVLGWRVHTNSCRCPKDAVDRQR